MAMLVAAVSGGIPKKPMSTAEVRRALLVPTAVPFACEEQNQKQKKNQVPVGWGRGWEASHSASLHRFFTSSSIARLFSQRRNARRR